jgi:ACR3 family arsenite transporter
MLSVALYIAAPVLISQALRLVLLARGPEAIPRALAALRPLSIAALLATLVLLFGFQGERIIKRPGIIALLAVPILIQVYLTSGFAYLLNRRAGEPHCVAGPSALIGASNFFELAVATAVSLFGFQSGAALATVVGVLAGPPVMLSAVWFVNRSKTRYESGPGQASRSIITPACGPPRNSLAMVRAGGETRAGIAPPQDAPDLRPAAALISAAGLMDAMTARPTLINP